MGAVSEAKDLAGYAQTCLTDVFSNSSDSLNQAIRAGIIKKPLYRTLYREMASAEISSMLDFSEYVSVVAKEAPIASRVQLERIAGSLAGFLLSTKAGE
jgi:hypothetical protein